MRFKSSAGPGVLRPTRREEGSKGKGVLPRETQLILTDIVRRSTPILEHVADSVDNQLDSDRSRHPTTPCKL